MPLHNDNEDQEKVVFGSPLDPQEPQDPVEDLRAHKDAPTLSPPKTTFDIQAEQAVEDLQDRGFLGNTLELATRVGHGTLWSNSLNRLTEPHFSPDPSFAWTEKSFVDFTSDIPIDYNDWIAEAQSMEQAEYRRAVIFGRMNSEIAVAEHGFTGIAATIVGDLLDPAFYATFAIGPLAGTAAAQGRVLNATRVATAKARLNKRMAELRPMLEAGKISKNEVVKELQKAALAAHKYATAPSITRRAAEFGLGFGTSAAVRAEVDPVTDPDSVLHAVALGAIVGGGSRAFGTILENAANKSLGGGGTALVRNPRNPYGGPSSAPFEGATVRTPRFGAVGPAPKQPILARPAPSNAPVSAVVEVARKYRQKKNFGLAVPEKVTKKTFDVETAKKIAVAFENMKHDPENPAVMAAYEAAASETMEQYKFIVENTDYRVELFHEGFEPYASSAHMLEDLRGGGVIKILQTEGAFGEAPITPKERELNPLLRESGIRDVNGKMMLYNDLFRFVHDLFGHGEFGNSFGPIGEETAIRTHLTMYSPLARKAVVTETRGQNSWVNFNKSLLNEDGSVKVKGDEGYVAPPDRPFAEQKVGLLPQWVVDFETHIDPSRHILPAETMAYPPATILPPREVTPNMTKAQIGEVATALGIKGRSRMSKDALIEAVNVHLTGQVSTSMSMAKLREVGNKLGVKGRSKEELVKKINEHDAPAFLLLRNVPFVGHRRRVKIGKFDSKAFVHTALEQAKSIRDNAGVSGHTFNLNGTTRKPQKGKKADIVPVVSWNVDVPLLSSEMISNFLKKKLVAFEDRKWLLDHLTVGVFKFDKDPTKASIDLNVVVPPKHRKNSIEVINAIGQESLWAEKGSKTVKNTVKNTGESTRDFTSDQLTRIVGHVAEGRFPLEISKPVAEKAPVLSDAEFKEWFKGSKIVGTEGEPTVLYHGSPNPALTKLVLPPSPVERAASLYGKGIYLSSHESEALGYTGGEGGFTYKAHVNLKNPLVGTSVDWSPETRKFLSEAVLRREGAVNQAWVDDKLDRWIFAIRDSVSGEEFTKALQMEGYDGVVDGDIHVVFNPDDIKLIGHDVIPETGLVPTSPPAEPPAPPTKPPTAEGAGEPAPEPAPEPRSLEESLAAMRAWLPDELGMVKARQFGGVSMSFVAEMWNAGSDVLKVLQILGIQSNIVNIEGGKTVPIIPAADMMADADFKILASKVQEVHIPAFKGWVFSRSGAQGSIMELAKRKAFRLDVLEFNRAVGNHIHGIETSPDPNVLASVKAHTELYQELAKRLHENGLTKELLKAEGYLPVHLKAKVMSEKIRTAGLEPVVELFAEAIRKANPKLSAKESSVMGRAYVSSVRSQALDQDHMSNGGFGEESLVVLERLIRSDLSIADETVDLILKKMGKGAKGPQFLRKRMEMDRSVSKTVVLKDGTTERISIGDFISPDVESLTVRHTRRVLGLLQTHEIGRRFNGFLGLPEDTPPMPMEDIRNLLKEELLNSGVNNKDALEIFDHARKIILGIPIDPPTTRIGEAAVFLQKLSLAAFAAGFGIAAFAEMGQAVANASIESFKRNVPEFWDIVKQVIKGEIPEGLPHDLQLFAGIVHPKYGRVSVLNRELTDLVNDGEASLQSLLDNLGDKALSWGGLLALDAIQRHYAAVLFSDNLINGVLAGGVPYSNIHLHQIGLTEDMAIRIVQMVQRHGRLYDAAQGGKKIGQLNTDKWEDIEAVEAFKWALNLHTKKVIHESSKGKYPRQFQGQLGRMFFQFRTFMVSAYEGQFLGYTQAMSEGDKRAFFSMLTNSMFAGLSYIAAITARYAHDKEKMEEYLTLDEIAKGMLFRSGWFTYGAPVLDTGLRMAGMNPVFSHGRSSGLASDIFSGSPSMAILNSAQGAVKSLIAPVVNPEYKFSEQDWRHWKTLAPLHNLIGFQSVISSVPEALDLPEKSKE